MDITIKQIKISELNDYIQSDEYKSNVFEPISRYRARSYFANPNSDKHDTALLLAYDQNKLIGYLGMLPDILTLKKEKIKFCWISCMWVVPEYRRSGIALQLLNEAFICYNGYIAITNYIPRSKSTFFKTGKYKELENLEGYRFYIRADLNNILKRKYPGAIKFSLLFKAFDTAFNFSLAFFRLVQCKKRPAQYTFQITDSINSELSDFIKGYSELSLFQRSPDEFGWIMDFPWVRNTKDPSIDYSKYHFSQYRKDFKQWFVEIKNKDEKLIGFLMLTRHNNELKTPYFFCSENIENDLADFMTVFIKQNHIRTLVTHNPQIALAYKKNGAFILQRRSNYGFLASDRIFELLHNKKKIAYDGDGDAAFT